MELETAVNAAWEDRALLKEEKYQQAIDRVIESLDRGELRCAEPTDDGWKVNEWVKKAVVLYFPMRNMETIEVGPFEFHDKMRLKSGYAERGVRVVPHALARYGAHIARGVVMMPSYVNIGAFVGENSMVD